MKKLKLVLLSIITFGIVSSCEDAYNIVQDGELNDDVAIQSVDDMQTYLNSVYSYVGIGSEIAFTAIFTDETGTGNGSGGQNFDTHRFQLTSANGYADGMWYGHYAAINRANRLIRAAANITPSVDDLDAYNSILAQARAIRAFSHFQLLSYFSTDLKDDSALGVILMNRVPDTLEDLPRNTNGEVFALIESDLDFAYNNVGTLSYKYITPNMINALRARMYLYRGNYALAQQYAQDVISNSGLVLTPATPVPSPAPINPNYSVFAASNPLSVGAPTSAWNNSFYGAASTNPYRKMFNDTSQGEIIFALDRPTAGGWENIAGNFATNTTSVSGSPFFEVGRNLFNELRSVPGDVRRYANVDPTSKINVNYDTATDYIPTDVLIIDKYPGKGSTPLRNDIKVFRLSEMYFILAECYARSGNFNGASNSTASVLKLIRDKRNFLGAQALPVYADATVALKDVLLERRKELSFEGHRYLDLKRLGVELGVSIDRNPTDDEVTGLPTTIPNTDYRFTMPIPTNELNANGNIQQNPGYN
jgi:hypothetical protein